MGAFHGERACLCILQACVLGIELCVMHHTSTHHDTGRMQVLGPGRWVAGCGSVGVFSWLL